MISAVLDSTTLVSAFLTDDGLSFEILQHGAAGRFQWFSAEEILQESRRVLIEEQRIRKKYHYTDEQVERFIERTRVTALMAKGIPEISVIKRDPKDDKVLACALAAQVHYIVSRDKDLLDLKSYRGIRMIKPEEFIHLVRHNH